MPRSRTKSPSPSPQETVGNDGLATVAPTGPANSQVQASLAANRTDPGFKGDLPSFQRRMESSFGASLSNVKLVGGDAGQAGLPAGAIALARGSSVWVGEAFAAMGAQGQEQVLAHELAHVMQQRQGRSVDPGPGAPRRTPTRRRPRRSPDSRPR